jgi:5-methylcytosine-specific restriction protein A
MIGHRKRVRSVERKEKEKEYDRWRFYEKNHRLYRKRAWQRLRRQQLLREPACIRCGAFATVVHHKIPHKGNPNLFFASTNLASICKRCHDSIENEEERLGYSKEFGVDGLPVDPRHPIYKQRTSIVDAAT